MQKYETKCIANNLHQRLLHLVALPLPYFVAAYLEFFILSPLLSSLQSGMGPMQMCGSEGNGWDVSMRHLYTEGHSEVEDCIGKGQSGSECN